MQSRVNEIDLLRFIAALAVVFFHYAFRGHAADHLSNLPYPLLAPLAKYGYLGVELFFMISGFVILMTASNANVKSFVISRISRLYPAFWIACTLTFAVTVYLGAPRFKASFSEYLGNMTMLGEFFGINALDGSYWSLFIELRFYLLIFLLLALKKIHHAETFLIVWLVISFVLEIKPVAALETLFITDYAAFFIAGATCFLIWAESLSLKKVLMLLSAWALSEYEVLSSLPSLEKHYQTTFNRFTIIGIVSSFFLILLLIAQRWTGLLAHKRWLVLGALTYPLYLIHQNIGYILFDQLYPGVNPHLLFWGTLGVMLGLAYSIYVVLEKPLANKLHQFLTQILKVNARGQNSNSLNSVN